MENSKDHKADNGDWTAGLLPGDVLAAADEIDRLQSVVGKAIHWAEHAMLMRSSQNKELLGILRGAVPNAELRGATDD